MLNTGTPSTCTNIGLHHVTGGEPPFDLVISGPNFGRNSSTVFTLGSGAIGGAMEAALVSLEVGSTDISLVTERLHCHLPSLMNTGRRRWSMTHVLCRQN